MSTFAAFLRKTDKIINMRKQIFTRITPILMCVCCFCVLPSKLHSQTTVLSKSFYGLNNEDVFSAISSYGEWTFENCFAKKDSYLQLGSSSSLGTATSPALGVEGNFALLIKTGHIVSGAKFRVSVVGTGTVAVTESECSVASDDSYRLSAILIKGCLPSTRIKIEGISGRFYLRTMKVLAISDALFYESFDYVDNGNSGEFVVGSEDATSSLCDNYSVVELKDCKRGKSKIYFNGTGNFTFSTLYADSDMKAILSFRTALVGSSVTHTLNISASEGVNMASLDNNDISSLQNTYNGELTGVYRTWQEHSIILTGLNSSSTVTIEGKEMFLDDVKLTPIPSGLDQSKDNSAYIEANADQVRTVTLTRTLTPGVWCPLCLPFDVTPNLMNSVTATTCELRTFSSVDTETGVFKFNSIEGESTIEAGTPFLIKTSAMVSNPTFTGVTIKDVAPVSYTNGDFQFVGIYSPVYLKTDGTNLFLGTDGSLYKPGTDEGHNRLGGMRAYFVVPAEAMARVAILDEADVTGIISAGEENRSYTMYDIFGRPVGSKASRGIIISKGRKWFNK